MSRRAPPRRGRLVAALAFVVVVCGGGAALGCAAGEWVGGIHARLVHHPERGLRVHAVPPDGPADEAGLRAGDRIVAIEGEPVEGLTPAEVRERLQGPVGTEVRLTLLAEDPSGAPPAPGGSAPPGPRRDVVLVRAPYTTDP